MRRRDLIRAGATAAAATLGLPGVAQAQGRTPAAMPACGTGTLYLTIDTGWGREAERIAAILAARGIRATLFIADEPSFRGDTTLSEGWAPFWRARAAEGHAFATHTWRHWYFRGDPAPGRTRFVAWRGGEAQVLDQTALCEELERPIRRLRQFAPDARVLPLWRAPGGITTPNALAMAAACGLRHQGWTARGFLGDELDAARHPNAALLSRNLGAIRDGEVLVMHWGVRSRQEPFAGILEPLLDGLLARGFCFAPLPPTGKA